MCGAACSGALLLPNRVVGRVPPVFPLPWVHLPAQVFLWVDMEDLKFPRLPSFQGMWTMLQSQLGVPPPEKTTSPHGLQILIVGKTILVHCDLEIAFSNSLLKSLYCGAYRAFS